MPLEPKLKTLLVSHVQDRARHRYGMPLSKTELGILDAKMRNGNYLLLAHKSKGRIECKVKVAKKELRVIYDPKTREVITLLPSSESAKLYDVFPDKLK